MKKFLLAFLLWLVLLQPALAATLLPMAQQQFFDNNGASLSSGTVSFYIPNTLTLKTTWQDANATVTNTNPVALDANGRALIYGFGSYRQIVKDSLGNTIWDQVTADTGGPVTTGGTSVGTNTITITYTPPVASLVTGGIYTFVAGGTNSTAATLNINGLGAKAVLKIASAGPTALTGGEITTNNIVVTVYDGTQFQLVSSSANTFTSTVSMTNAAFNEAAAIIASAATTDIGAALGNYLQVTGTTTITGFGTVQAGSQRVLRFAGALGITQGANVITLSGSSITVGVGDVMVWRSEGAGVWREISHFRFGSGIGPTLPRGALGGFILSNDAGSPNTVLDIGSGQAADSTNQQPIVLGAFTKSIAGNWVIGTGSNGMGPTLVATASTWYHVCAAVIAAVADVFFDTDPACAAHQPANTNYVRRVGSFKLDGSVHILAFKQVGNTFYLGASILDVNEAAATAQTFKTMTIPLGVKTRIIAQATSNGSDTYMFGSGDQPNEAPSATITPLGQAVGTTGTLLPQPYSNTSGQIWYRSISGGATLRIATLGWIDDRGRFD